MKPFQRAPRSDNYSSCRLSKGRQCGPGSGALTSDLGLHCKSSTNKSQPFAKTCISCTDSDLGNYSLQQISRHFIVYTCLYIIISICLLNVVNVLKECLKIPVFPKSSNIV